MTSGSVKNSPVRKRSGWKNQEGSTSKLPGGVFLFYLSAKDWQEPKPTGVTTKYTATAPAADTGVWLALRPRLRGRSSGHIASGRNRCGRAIARHVDWDFFAHQPIHS